MDQPTKQPITTAPGLKLTRHDGTLRDSALIRPNIPSLYTLSQISQYLAVIGIQHYDAKTFVPTLENLERLVRLHILAFPFENTAMHYTPDHQMDVTPEGAFRRLVVERGGSYCFGHGTVFLHVLRGLGYRAYAGSARVNEALGMASTPTLSIQDHMILFVQPFPICSDKKHQTYLVDPWLGLRTPVRPILLSDKEDNIVMGPSPYERHRLTKSPHPSSSLDFSPVSIERADFCWNVEYQGPNRKGDTHSQWILLFTFTENEFFAEDAEAYSFVVCNKPGGALRGNVTAVRHLSFEALDEAGLAEAAKEFAQYSEDERKTFLWQYTLSRDKVKRRVGSNSIIIQTLENEADRIRVLRELFGIVVSDDSCSHIAGMPSALI